MIGITGANGLLGSFIIRKLIDANEKFIAFKRSSGDTSLLRDLGDRVEWRDLDLQDPVSMEEALKDVDSVVHAAALVSFDPRHVSAISRINVDGTRHLVNACLANKVSRFVFISSVGALGRVKGQTRIDERNKWVENARQTPYATSKYLSELEVFRGQEEGLSTVILNPSVILAPADWAKSSARLFKYAWDEHRFYIDGSMNYVDVRDVATAALALLKSGMENERFIVNAGAVSYKEFFDAVATRFGKKPPMIKLGSNILKIATRIEAVRAKMCRSVPLVTPDTARLAGTNFLFQNDKIKKSLNFEFQSLDTTLDWCCAYYMQKFGRKKG
jgi:dihydroflavonol-4-reductase